MSILTWLTRVLLWASVLLFGLSILFRVNDVYLNTSSSLSLGLYQATAAPISKNTYVFFCPPEWPIFYLARERHYINSGACPGGYGLLLKRVFAMSGDTVAIDRSGVYINGKWLPNSAQRAFDPKNKALPLFELPPHALTDSELLLMSDVNSQSFDARYFGLINRKQIRSVVRPLIIWN